MFQWRAAPVAAAVDFHSCEEPVRISRMLPGLVFVTLVVFSVAVYPELPDRLVTSVGASGQATHLRAKTPLVWGMLPVLSLGVLGMMQWIRARLPARPDLFNFPGKEDLLKLPRELHPHIVAIMQQFMDAIAAFTMLVMLAAQVLLWHASRGGTSSAGTILLIVGPSLTVPFTFLYLQRVTDAVERARREWESRRPPRAA